MSIPVYDRADLIELKATFKNDSGTPTDPSAPTFSVQEPDGTQTVYVYPTATQVVRASAGVYTVNWSAAKPGFHYWRASGTGAVVAAEPGVFLVRLDAFYAPTP